MKKSSQVFDGFIRRKDNRKLGEHHNQQPKKTQVGGFMSRTHNSDKSSRPIQSSGSGFSIRRQDIEESLSNIDNGASTGIKLGGLKNNKPHRKRFGIKKIIILFFVILLLSGLGVAGYLGYKFISAGNNVFKGDIFGVLKNEPLKADANGRSNFIIFGTAEDDEGGEHGGRNLTDSIMVVSVDQEAKNAYMVSLPRDLWVTYDETCSVGVQGKLNATYFCASNDGVDEQAGAEALQKKAGEVLGMDIQYYIHLNFTAVVQAVDAVGGVQVVIESDDPRGIFDDNFDWKCNYKCNMVKYPNGLTPVLDGQHALALARARGASGNTYGLPNANFDREKNQQKILEALRQKALSTGTLTNLSAVTGLIDAMGKNLRTNIETKELRTMMSLATDIPPESIKSVSLVEPEDPQVTTGFIYGQSIVKPILGIYDFDGIHEYIAQKITSNPIVIENAEVVVLNGSGVVGAGQTEADKLKTDKYNVVNVSTADENITSSYVVYQLDSTKKATAEALAKRYGVSVITEKPTFSVSDGVDFVVIVGPAPAPSQ